MKAFPATKAEWAAAVLFPFKSYVFLGLPVLKVCQFLKDVIQPHFYGEPEEAKLLVSAGYVFSGVALLIGAYVQVRMDEADRAFQTAATGILGLLLFAVMWPWGLAGR